MLHELFFEVGPAIKVIFSIGEKPVIENFVEINKDFCDYKGDEKVFRWDLKGLSNRERNICVTEKEMQSLFKADDKIMSYIEDEHSFIDYDEILTYVAKMLPPVFSKSSKYSSCELDT